MPARTTSLDTIVCAAIEIASTEGRAAFLADACGEDDALRRRVEQLVAAHFRAGSFLESPIRGASETLEFRSPAGASGPNELAAEVGPGNAIGAGSIVGPYKLVEAIGEGGMGVVYMAEQKAPVRRMVALKVIKPGMDSRQVVARFEAERQALALMDHPNIARVLEAGTTDSGQPYFVMELVRGLPITDYCDRARVPLAGRLELFVLVCRAVQHAHQKGIIHRDIKPSNVLITLHDGVPVPKVIDFGIAKDTGQALTEKTLHTGFTQLVGTPLYMSPEQAEFSGLDIDTRSDIYSLGVLLYELLTGTTPFNSETLRKAAFDEMRRMIREDEPPKPSTRLSALDATLATVSANRDIDPRKLPHAVRGELDWIAMKALEKDRRRRYETAGDFAADVMRHLTDRPVEACPPSARYRLGKFTRRNRKGLLTLALSSASGLIVAFVMGTVYLRDVDRARQVTQDVREALAGARTAIEARDLTLASQRVAEAQGCLKTDRTSMPDLAEEVDRTRREIEARQTDEVRFHRFLKEASDAQDSMSYGDGRPEDRLGEEALGLYGVLTERDWLSRLETSSLTADRKRQVRETAYVTLVSLADFAVRWKEMSEDPSSAARSLGLLNRAQAFHQPTRAFYFVRAECHRRRGDTAAAEEDEKRFKAAAARTAWDYFLPGHTAGWGGDLDEAIRSYQAALRLQPDHFNSLFFLAMRFSTDKINRRPEAVQLFTACLALRPDHVPSWRNRGVSLARLDRWDDAMADYRQALRLKPDDAPTHNNLGNALKQRGKVDEAIAEYREAIRLKPDDSFAHYNIGRALHQQGKRDEAMAAYREALRLKPAFAEARTNLGNVLQEQGKVDEAIAAYREAIRRSPDFPEAHIAYTNLANSLGKQGEVDEAIAAYREAIRRKPDIADTHLKLGNAMKLQGKLDEAVAAFREALRHQPDMGCAYNNLGNALREQGKLDEAIAACREAVRLGPANHADHHDTLGNALDQQGRPDEAIAAYREALRLKPDFPEAHYGLGNAVKAQWKLDEAIAAYREALRLKPAFAEARTNLGIVLRKQGKLDEAIAAYREALRLKPDFPEAHKAYTNLGNALREQGKVDEAIAAYREALRLRPDSAEAHNCLAWSLANSPDPRLRDPAQAVALARRAVELAPRNSSNRNTLGVAHYRAGDWGAAVAALEKSMEIVGGGIALDWWFLAMAHWQLGRKDEARTWYDKALAWMEDRQPRDEELLRFRAEAVALMGIDPAEPGTKATPERTGPPK